MVWLRTPRDKVIAPRADGIHNGISAKAVSLDLAAVQTHDSKIQWAFLSLEWVSCFCCRNATGIADESTNACPCHTVGSFC